MNDGLSIITIGGFTLNIFAASIALFFAILGYAFWKALRANRLNWVDIITRDGKKVSLTKLLQLIGGVTASWIVIKLTLTKELNWDIFAIYLAYVAGVDGYSKFLTAKYSGGKLSATDSNEKKQDYPDSTMDIPIDYDRPSGSKKAE